MAFTLAALPMTSGCAEAGNGAEAAGGVVTPRNWTPSRSEGTRSGRLEPLHSRNKERICS